MTADSDDVADSANRRPKGSIKAPKAPPKDRTDQRPDQPPAPGEGDPRRDDFPTHPPAEPG
jgi:hypothetical protein